VTSGHTKLDENLPERLLPVLVELGHDVDTVVAEGLKGATDSDLWPVVFNERDDSS
jgi:hypothetical protein